MIINEVDDNKLKIPLYFVFNYYIPYCLYMHLNV